MPHPDSERCNDTVEFANELMQKVAYSLLPYAARRPIHEAVARYREHDAGVSMTSWDSVISNGGSNSGDDLAELLSTLAYHWGRSGHHQRALWYLGMAGERAMVRRTNASETNREYHAYVCAADCCIPPPACRTQEQKLYSADRNLRRKNGRMTRFLLLIFFPRTLTRRLVSSCVKLSCISHRRSK